MDNIEKARRYYEATLQRNRDAWNRKKDEKIANGTYRGRGRPRKNTPPTPPPEIQEVAVNSHLNNVVVL